MGANEIKSNADRGREIRHSTGEHMMKTSIVAAAFSAVLTCSFSVRAEDSVPKGWSFQGTKPAAYEIKPDPTQKGAHGNSISIQSRGETDGMATLMQVIKADDFRGKRVRFFGHIKGENVKAWAALWMRINNADGTVSAFDNMEKRAFRGSGDWKKFEVVLDVPNESSTISFGALLSGSGHVWVGGLDFQTVDETVPVTAKSKADLNRKPVNLEFN